VVEDVDVEAGDVVVVEVGTVVEVVVVVDGGTVTGSGATTLDGGYW
jgi:hypothetical protein